MHHDQFYGEYLRFEHFAIGAIAQAAYLTKDGESHGNLHF
jgi:hypothetical protein